MTTPVDESRPAAPDGGKSRADLSPSYPTPSPDVGSEVYDAYDVIRDGIGHQIVPDWSSLDVGSRYAFRVMWERATKAEALLVKAREGFTAIEATSILGPEVFAHYNAHRESLRVARLALLAITEVLG